MDGRKESRLKVLLVMQKDVFRGSDEKSFMLGMPTSFDINLYLLKISRNTKQPSVGTHDPPGCF